MAVADVSPSFWCSADTLIRPYSVTLLWANAAVVPSRASAAMALCFIMEFIKGS